MASVADYGLVGVELDDRHPDIHPGDDLYRHMNEQWSLRNPIPADKARFGAFTVLAENAERHVRDIAEAAIDAPVGTEEHKVGALFRSFMDEAGIASRGLDPLRQRLDDLAANAQSLDQLLRWMGRAERLGLAGLMQMFIDNDPGSPDRYVIFVEQDGLSLPDEAYYRDDQFAEIRDAFVAHVTRVFEFVGIANPATKAAQVMDFETKLAAHHWDQVRCRDAQATYNLRSWDDATALAEGFDIEAWREESGVDHRAVAEVVIRQPDFVSGMATVWSGSTPKQVEAWLSWRLIIQFAPYLTDELVDLHFDFFGRTLTGTPELRARWKRGAAFVESVMGEAVGKLFVEKHFPVESKEKMDALVTTLLDAYRDSISHLTWMSDATKKRALEKLDTFVPKIGYPEKWRDYSALTVSDSDLIANVEASSEFEFARELAKIGRPIDRAEWFMTPQTVNAYYNPGFNEIVFPAAILQYPFFDPERDAAANYGAIGAVIGHEIGHGFDDQGSRFDGEGRLTDWWNEDDRERFEELTQGLIDQFSQLEPRQLPGHRVNGELTIGENIGDLGGLAIAWKAYLASLNGAEPPVIDGVSAAERFFLSWAQSWRFSARDEEAKRLLQIDPHSPAEFRCNQIARNLDLFYDAFGVTKEHELWLDPADRVSIW